MGVHGVKRPEARAFTVQVICPTGVSEECLRSFPRVVLEQPTSLEIQGVCSSCLAWKERQERAGFGLGEDDCLEGFGLDGMG